jgi:hypothetical protein
LWHVAYLIGARKHDFTLRACARPRVSVFARAHSLWAQKSTFSVATGRVAHMRETANRYRKMLTCCGRPPKSPALSDSAAIPAEESWWVAWREQRDVRRTGKREGGRERGGGMEGERDKIVSSMASTHESVCVHGCMRPSVACACVCVSVRVRACLTALARTCTRVCALMRTHARQHCSLL